MNTNDLKLFAINKVIGSNNFDAESKLQVLNYIKESDHYDIMAFLLDEKPYTLTEQSTPIVEARFKRSPLNEEFNEFLAEGPLDVIKKGIESGGEILGGIKDATSDFLAGAGDFFTALSDKFMNMVGSVANKLKFDDMVKKFSDVLDSTLKKLNVKSPEATSKFQELTDKLPDSIKNNPQMAGIAIALSLVAVISFAVLLKKKKNAKVASEEVKKKLNKNASSMDKDKQKVAKEIAKNF